MIHSFFYSFDSSYTMDSEPVIRARNVAEPRTFITKWDQEIDKKVKRKKAFSKNRDSKYSDHFDNDNDVYTFHFNSVYSFVMCDGRLVLKFR